MKAVNKYLAVMGMIYGILFLNPMQSYADIRTGLVGWWRLNESLGTTAADSSGNGNTGTFANSLVSVGGKIGNAISFNGSTQYITLPNSLINNLSVMTFSVWFKTSSGGILIGYQNTAYPTVPGGWVPIVYVGTDGKMRSEIWMGAVTPIASAGTYTDNLWHQATFVVDTNLQTLYVDGVSVGTLVGSVSNFGGVNNQIGLGYTGGGWPGGNGDWYFFPGSIDDVRIYNRVLNAADVAQLYKTGSRNLRNVHLSNMKITE